ncbi:uncharacterized protein LOC130421374 isoform X2 [Triplophysa dalaica]|uniref:uncharacterized protein LOC130421374 isoform X2 n=1 Tax=Triplophysa dalaica TaxID=1582913 RepID=UPI0024DF76C6|nr:uncharacterized protein LOC130421374 isoform X2 [Triplophysa dalaica]
MSYCVQMPKHRPASARVCTPYPGELCSEFSVNTRIRTKDRFLTPPQEAELHINFGRDKNSVFSKYINETKGRGVFAKECIAKGSFILQYRGTLYEESNRKFSEVSNPYAYYFKHNGNGYCIDASHDDGSLGRLVNDDKKPNAKMLKIEVNGMPHLCLFAMKNIPEGQEITYDYGGADLPWRLKREHSKTVLETTTGKQSQSAIVALQSQQDQDDLGMEMPVNSTNDQPCQVPSADAFMDTEHSKQTVLETTTGKQSQSAIVALQSQQDQDDLGMETSLTSVCKHNCTTTKQLSSFEKCVTCTGPFSPLKWVGVKCKDDESFFALQSELEVLEKQIHDLLERQTRLRERKTAMETSRADARKAAVSVRRDCNTPITSTPCVSMHRAQASRSRRAEMNFTPAPAHTRRKAKSRTGAMTSPPPPRPVFEISTRNRFAALCETKSNAVVIGDSIVRNVRASFNEGKVRTHCFPGPRVLDVSAQVTAILKEDARVGAVVLHAGVMM